MTPSNATPVTGDALAKRNALLLVMAQALGGAGPSIIISLGGIVGQGLAPSPALITVPVSLYSLGLALGTLPAAYIMRQYGRRIGYVLGAMIAASSGTLATAGIVFASFWMFCIGTFIAGFSGAYVQSYRFAATDSASPTLRPKVISWVMIGGLISATIGPQLVIWTRDSLPGQPFAGSFLSQAGLALLALPVLWFLRTPPMAAEGAQGGRPLSVILRDPRFLLAVAAGVMSYALMSFVMTAAPIAMVGCGFTVGEAALGIQWHVLAMFGPSFFTGKLIARFGKEKITAIGLAIIAVSGLVALSGVELAHFWGSLVLLGLGWNFGFIGATAMVTDCHTPEERTKVQGANDFLLFGFTAAASFSSGGLLNATGWTTINLIILPCIALVLVPLLWRLRPARSIPTA